MRGFSRVAGLRATVHRGVAARRGVTSEPPALTSWHARSSWPHVTALCSGVSPRSSRAPTRPPHSSTCATAGPASKAPDIASRWSGVSSRQLRACTSALAWVSSRSSGSRAPAAHATCSGVLRECEGRLGPAPACSRRTMYVQGGTLPQRTTALHTLYLAIHYATHHRAHYEVDLEMHYGMHYGMQPHLQQ